MYTVCRLKCNTAFVKSMFVGYCVSMLNFLGLVFHIKKSFGGNIIRGVAGNSFFRFILVGFVLYLWFKYGELNIWGLLVGLTFLTITIPIYTIYENRRNSDGTST
ncbi:MAG: ATP synthase subunit I [Deferribacterales bacterium]